MYTVVIPQGAWKRNTNNDSEYEYVVENPLKRLKIDPFKKWSVTLKTSGFYDYGYNLQVPAKYRNKTTRPQFYPNQYLLYPHTVVQQKSALSGFIVADETIANTVGWKLFHSIVYCTEQRTNIFNPFNTFVIFHFDINHFARHHVNTDASSRTVLYSYRISDSNSIDDDGGVEISITHGSSPVINCKFVYWDETYTKQTNQWQIENGDLLPYLNTVYYQTSTGNITSSNLADCTYSGQILDTSVIWTMGIIINETIFRVKLWNGSSSPVINKNISHAITPVYISNANTTSVSVDHVIGHPTNKAINDSTYYDDFDSSEYRPNIPITVYELLRFESDLISGKQNDFAVTTYFEDIYFYGEEYQDLLQTVSVLSRQNQVFVQTVCQ
jgi:hypothetical protein